MYISYIERLSQKKLSITLDDGETIILSEKEFSQLKEDDHFIDDHKLEVFYKDYLLPKAKLKALNLLKVRDHSKKELVQKLMRAGFPQSIIDQTMAYIDSYHYIDDERFAYNYVAYRGKMKSKKELRYELSLKGIDMDRLDRSEDYMDELDDKETIRVILHKKWGEDIEVDMKEKDRMTRYLFRRGFGSSDIFSVYRELGI